MQGAFLTERRDLIRPDVDIDVDVAVVEPMYVGLSVFALIYSMLRKCPRIKR